MTHRHDIIRAADEYAAAFAKNPCADACTDARTRVVQAVGLLEARCERLRELGMSAGVLGDAMTNDQWVAAWARHREAMRACESHGDLEE